MWNHWRMKQIKYQFISSCKMLNIVGNSIVYSPAVTFRPIFFKYPSGTAISISTHFHRDESIFVLLDVCKRKHEAFLLLVVCLLCVSGYAHIFCQLFPFFIFYVYPHQAKFDISGFDVVASVCSTWQTSKALDTQFHRRPNEPQTLCWDVVFFFLANKRRLQIKWMDS